MASSMKIVVRFIPRILAYIAHGSIIGAKQLIEWLK
jgi:hypothetical protein